MSMDVVLLQAAGNKLASHNFSISGLMHRTYTSINFNSVIDVKLLFTAVHYQQPVEKIFIYIIYGRCVHNLQISQSYILIFINFYVVMCSLHWFEEKLKIFFRNIKMVVFDILDYLFNPILITYPKRNRDNIY